MAQDFARKRKPPAKRKKAPASRKSAAPPPRSTSGPRWFFAGLLSGVVLSFLFYLYTLPPAPGEDAAATAGGPAAEQEQPPRPRFDFYTLLPEATDDEPAPAPAEDAPSDNTQAPAPPSEYYLLQAGSFRQQEDADRRRAELLMLGLEPQVEQADGDTGRWYRVYLGPFDSRGEVNRARSLTAAEDIDTLLLKRNARQD